MKIWWKVAEPVYVITDDETDLSQEQVTMQRPGGPGTYQEPAFRLKKKGLNDQELQEFLDKNAEMAGAYQIAHGLDEVKAAMKRELDRQQEAGYLG